MAMATVTEAIEEYRSGRFVIIVDDEGRENEGDLTLPAEFVTPEPITFMIRPPAFPADLVMPGHVYPLRVREGGVLVRAGHTEATVDLCKLAGLESAAVLCEVMKSDGTMARLPYLKRFAPRHNA